MQITCTFCATPFAIGKDEAETAIQKMVAEKLSFYNVHCPHCRRAIKVTRQQFKLFPPYRKMFEEQGGK